MVEERSYLAAEDRVQADSIRLHRVYLYRRSSRESSVNRPHSHPGGPQATWMSLEAHPQPWKGRVGC